MSKHLLYLSEKKWRKKNNAKKEKEEEIIHLSDKTLYIIIIRIVFKASNEKHDEINKINQFPF